MLKIFEDYEDEKDSFNHWASSHQADISFCSSPSGRDSVHKLGGLDNNEMDCFRRQVSTLSSWSLLIGTTIVSSIYSKLLDQQVVDEWKSKQVQHHICLDIWFSRLKKHFMWWPNSRIMIFSLQNSMRLNPAKETSSVRVISTKCQITEIDIGHKIRWSGNNKP